MTDFLIICDGAPVPADWRARQWTHRETINHYHAAPNLTLKVENLSHRVLGGIYYHAADFVRIAAYAYAADQCTRRWTPTDADGKRWRRRLALCIPVKDPEFWEQPHVKADLVEALSFVSEDDWEFAFTHGHPPEQLGSNMDLDMLHGSPDAAVAFSGGADSLCAIVDVVTQGRRPLLVSHRPTPPTSSRQVEVARRLRGQFPAWAFPHISSWIHRMGSDAVETTQRARSFLYASLCTAIAVSLGLEEVVLADNGIVSINLPINDQLVGALASRSTHPKFLYLFRRLAESVFGQPLLLYNPLWDKTRAESLELLVKADAQSLLTATVSCGSPRGRPNARPHCGVCSQCVGRRFGTLAASLEAYDPPTGYRVDIFKQGLPEGFDQTLVVSFVRFAHHVLELADDALVDRFPQFYDLITQDDPTPGQTGMALVSMVRRHAEQVSRVMRDQVIVHADTLAAGKMPVDNVLALFASGRPEPGASPLPGREATTTKPFLHSEDYRSVTWRGRTFSFSPQQAAVIALLHAAYRAGAPDVSWEQFRQRLESYPGRMSDIFKGHPSWNTLIRSPRKGLYHLAI